MLVWYVIFLIIQNPNIEKINGCGTGSMTKILKTIDDVILELSSVYSNSSAPISVHNTYNNVKKYSMDKWSRLAINSIAQQIQQSQYITQKQGNLALKIIRRYRKQLYKNGYDVKALVKDPIFEYKFRHVDYTKLITIENDLIHIKFPYDEKVIKYIKLQKNSYLGEVIFDYNDKLWKFDLLEDFFHPDIITFFIEEGFKLSNEVKIIYEKCEQIRKSWFNHKLILNIQDGNLKFQNCPKELINHFVKHVGKLDETDLSIIVDKCSDYGVKVAESVKKLFVETYGDLSTKDIYFNKEAELDVTNTSITELVNYIKIVNRYPVCVVTPGRMSLVENSNPKDHKYYYKSLKKYFRDSIINNAELQSKRDKSVSDCQLGRLDKYQVIIDFKVPDGITPELLIIIKEKSLISNVYSFDYIDQSEKIIYYS